MPLLEVPKVIPALNFFIFIHIFRNEYSHAPPFKTHYVIFRAFKSPLYLIGVRIELPFLLWLVVLISHVICFSKNQTK